MGADIGEDCGPRPRPLITTSIPASTPFNPRRSRVKKSPSDSGNPLDTRLVNEIHFYKYEIQKT